jgi:hypothetical protein
MKNDHSTNHVWQRNYKLLRSNDAMRIMWYATYSDMRFFRHTCELGPLADALYDAMGEHHTWRVEPRQRVAACALAALTR